MKGRGGGEGGEGEGSKAQRPPGLSLLRLHCDHLHCTRFIFLLFDNKRS